MELNSKVKGKAKLWRS